MTLPDLRHRGDDILVLPNIFFAILLADWTEGA